MPSKTTGGARQATRPAATDSMHPADLEGLVADLKLKASTPEGRSRLWWTPSPVHEPFALVLLLARVGGHCRCPVHHAKGQLFCHR